MRPSRKFTKFSLLTRKILSLLMVTNAKTLLACSQMLTKTMLVPLLVENVVYASLTLAIHLFTLPCILITF